MTISAIMRCVLLVGLSTLLAAPQNTVQAQTADTKAAIPETPIAARPDDKSDVEIQQRITDIYAQIDSLAQLKVSVSEGVASLSGEVANDKQAQRALDLANRLEGIVTVEDHIERTLDVEGNVTPVIDKFQEGMQRLLKALPLILVAMLVFAVITFLGFQLAKLSALWRRVSPNVFLADLLAQAVRVAAVVLGLVVALNLLGATALLGTVLGGAGVLGIAIGFAVRDSMENYISSIMLSIRQPFRANDHVVINEHEGIVMRLTSRATVLMTLDGNHLRITNSTVFKAVILNYTRNPERRFGFELGIDADDDPLAAMKLGVEAICALDFTLAEPEPVALVESVGDSNIVLSFMAWVDQRHTDFGKARSVAISAAKNVLEQQGFTLPEPIYRVRFDDSVTRVNVPSSTPSDEGTQSAPTKDKPAVSERDSDAILDVRPNNRLREKVDAERAQDSENNLLDHARPVE